MDPSELVTVKSRIDRTYIPTATTFIQTSSIGNEQLWEERLYDDGPLMNRIFNTNQISGYLMMIVHNYKEADENLVLNIREIIQKIGSNYPFIIVNMSIYEEYQSDIKDYLLSFNYIAI